MSFIERMRGGSSVTSLAKVTSTIPTTGDSRQFALIQKAVEKLQDKLRKENMDTIAWIVGKVEFVSTAVGMKAFQSSVGKIVYNPSYTAKLVAGERDDAVETALFEALPGLNFGGPITDHKKITEAIQNLVAAMDALVYAADPTYKGPIS